MKKVIGITILLFVSGCGGKDKIEKGIAYLQGGRYGEARDMFYESAERGEQKGYFGVMLSDFMRAIEIADYIYTVAGGHPTDKNFSPFEGDENLFLYETLMEYLSAFKDIIDEGLEAGRNVTDDFTIELPYIPLYVGGKESLNFGGLWNGYDVRFLRGVMGILSSLIHLILSQELYADYYSIFEYAKPILFEGGIDPGDPLKPVSFKSIVNILIFVFESSPKFLSLRDETEWNLFKDYLILGVEDILTSLEGNGEKIKVVKESESAWKLMIKDFTVNENGEIEDLTRGMDEDALNTVNDLLLNLKGEKPYLRWDEFSVFLAFVVSTLLGEVELSGVTITDPYPFLKAILPGLLGESIAFNINGFLSNPVGLRTFIPPYRVDDTPEDNFFLLEWECPAEMPSSADVGTFDYFPEGLTSISSIGWLLCSGRYGFEDTSHFTDSIYNLWEISPIFPDGISSPFPYIPLKDPSFNNLILINTSYVGYDKSYPSEYTYPDLRLFNFFLQKEVGSILNVLVGGF